MPSPTATAIHVEKFMSLSRGEFAKSIDALAGVAVEMVDDTAHLPEGDGIVRIAYHALAPKRLGGLLLLPQARVTLDITGLDEARAVAILQRIELAFQRGGG